MKITCRQGVIKNLNNTITDLQLSSIPNLTSYLASHLEKYPDEKVLGKYHLFRSGGASSDLLYVLYDEKMWSRFVDEHKKSLLNSGDGKLKRTVFVGSLDRQHTIYRLAKAIDPHAPVFGFQSPVDEIIQGLTQVSPETVMCYGGLLHVLFEMFPSGELPFKTPSFVCTTEGVADEVALWAKNILKANICSVISSTELGVIGETCQDHTLHLSPNIEFIQHTQFGSVFTNAYNTVQPFINYELPLQIDPVNDCRCGAKNAYKIRSGRPARLLTFGQHSSKQITIHPVAFRSKLDNLQGFPGAHIHSSNGQLTISLCEDYSSKSVKAAVEEVLKNHGCETATVKIVKA